MTELAKQTHPPPTPGWDLTKDEYERLRAYTEYSMAEYGLRSLKEKEGESMRPYQYVDVEEPAELLARMLARAEARYDPEKGSLYNYLKVSVDRELLNVASKRAKLAARDTDIADLESASSDPYEGQQPITSALRQAWTNKCAEPLSGYEASSADLDASCVRSFLERLVAHGKHLDANVLELMIRGHKPREIAVVLGVVMGDINNAKARIKRGLYDHFLEQHLDAGSEFVHKLWRQLDLNPDDTELTNVWSELAHIWKAICDDECIDAIADQLNLGITVVRQARKQLQAARKALPDFIKLQEV